MRFAALAALCSFFSGPLALAQGSATAPKVPVEPQAAEAFQQVSRPGSVDLDGEYDLSGLSIPRDEIHTLLPRDAIPALADPETAALADATWPDEARLVVLEAGLGDARQVVGVPILVLNWHEIANMTVGGVPVAATYCPLCNSATAIDRRVPGPNGESSTLEFGVSGALFNSNVLMYDRQTLSLWSQLEGGAVSGPRVGTKLRHLPVRLMTVAQLREAHPSARVVTADTGHERDYTVSPYEQYFQNDRLLVPVAKMGDKLPRKTLGVGVAAGAMSWFVPASAIGDGLTLTTPLGEVELATGDAGVRAVTAPEGVRTVQTMYYSWSAFHPDTIVISGK